MASEIRVDKITSLSGVGTISPSPTGVEIAGITTVATLKATTGIVTTLTAGSLITSSAVGVGTTITHTSAKLDVFQEGTRSAGYLFLVRAGLNVGKRGYGLYPPSTDSASDPFVWNTGNSHSFEVDNVDRLRIHHSGRIGIGTDDPAADLHISSGNNTEIRIADTTTTPSYARIIYNNDADNADALVFEVDGGNDISGSNIRFKADGNELARITGIGSFGIGITSPKTDLDIANNAGGTLTLSCSDDSSSADQLIGKINFHTADPSGDGPQNNAIISAHSVTNNGSAAYLKFSTAKDIGSEGADAVERLRITSDGQILVGATSADADNKMLIQDSGTTILKINNTDDGTAQITLANTGSSNGQIKQVSGYMTFSIAGSEKLRIQSGGGISFNGDTATANALDDYEEGTFTPTTNQGSFTSAEGKYTKIGNQVTVWIYIPTISNTTSTDFFNVQSLPFSGDANMVQATGSVMIRYINAASPDGVNFSTYQDGGWSYLRIYACRDDGNNYEAVRHSDFTQTSPGLRICHTYQAA